MMPPPDVVSFLSSSSHTWPSALLKARRYGEDRFGLHSFCFRFSTSIFSLFPPSSEAVGTEATASTEVGCSHRRDGSTLDPVTGLLRGDRRRGFIRRSSCDVDPAVPLRQAGDAPLRLAMACHALPWLAMACHALPWLAMPCHGLPCLAMPCHALPWLAMPCHALPCLAMPCHAMACHAFPWQAIAKRGRFLRGIEE